MNVVSLRVALGGYVFLALVSVRLWAQRPAEPHAVPPHIQAGIVVQEIVKASEAERAGLVQGDVILGWSRGARQGPIASPFDLSTVEIEQVPLSAVTLKGLRGTQEAEWIWSESHAFPQADWGIATRPNFAGQLLSRYQEAVKAEKNGNKERASDAWRSIAEQAQSQGLPPELSAWLLLQSATALAGTKAWDKVDLTCGQAVQASPTGVLAAKVATACASLSNQNNRPEQAEKYYQQALRYAQQTNAKGLQAASLLNALGSISAARQELDRALELTQAALQIQEQGAPNSLLLSRTENRIGLLFQLRGDLDQSEQYFKRSLARLEKLAPDSTLLARILLDLGNTLVMRGDSDKAEPYLLRALQIREKLQPNSGAVAAALIDLSNAADDHGDWAKAEEYLRRALVIQNQLPPHSSGMGASLNNLGLILQERGQLAEAEQYLKQSLAIKQEVAPGSLSTSGTAANLGDVYRELGDLEQAEKYLLGHLAVVEKVAPKSITRGITYTQLGDLEQRRQDNQRAEEYYRKALAVLLDVSPGGREAGDAFHRIGDMAFKRGDLQEAEKNYLQALAVRQKLSQASAFSAATLMGLAEVAQARQQWDLAEQRFQQAVDALEGQTARIGGAEAVRAGFRAQYENYYKHYADLLIHQAKPDRAFDVLERSRARTLLETLAVARVDIHAGVSSDLLGQERALRASITSRSERRISLLAGKHSDEQVASLDQEIKDLLAQYEQVESRIRENSPRYADLTQPQPLAARDVQRMLNSDTILLEFALGEERSYVLAVTPGSVAAYELPRRSEVESVARTVHDSLTARGRKIQGEAISERRARLAQADKRYAEESARLSKMLLGPVAKQILGQRLLIVSDGALQYVPFSALPVPATVSNPALPMMAEHEIINLPSASTLAVLRDQQHERKVPPKAVAVLADPVFSEHDARVSRRASQSPHQIGSTSATDQAHTSYDQLTRSVRDIGLDLSRLPFTRREADAIYALAPAHMAMKALDFDASRSLATGPNLSQYRIVHFATHGLLDSKQPELSGLVLSLVDQQGKPQSGFLGLEDVYNMSLPAELVVLSACETGLGKEIRGEGLIGLTRGFMYAGASRVMASLWNVNDVATAALMKRFYEGVLRQGLPPAAALRNAQRDLLQHTRWKSPYYWAAFQLQGDWK